jgi:hypothetical protein
MDIKISKTTLSILIIILATALVVNSIIYQDLLNQVTKARQNLLIQEQSVAIKKLINHNLEKQKELDMLKEELNTAKNELNEAKQRKESI